MSVDSEFEDAVKICEFYAESADEVEVDLENQHISMGDYGIDLVVENGCLVTYLVEEPDGCTLFANDLDSYFHGVFDWEDR